MSGDEVIHCILDVMYARAPYTVLQRAMHIHPTEAHPDHAGESAAVAMIEASVETACETGHGRRSGPPA
jgi:hypothetical protein